MVLITPPTTTLKTDYQSHFHIFLNKLFEIKNKRAYIIKFTYVITILFNIYV